MSSTLEGIQNILLLIRYTLTKLGKEPHHPPLLPLERSSLTFESKEVIVVLYLTPYFNSWYRTSHCQVLLVYLCIVCFTAQNVNCMRAEIVPVLFSNDISEPRNVSGICQGRHQIIYLFINERKETHAFFLDLRWDMEFLFSFFFKKKTHIFL